MDELEMSMCIVCMDLPVATRFGTCGHACLCGPCLDQLLRQQRPKCPICRSDIDDSLIIRDPGIAFQPAYIQRPLEVPVAGSHAHEEVGSGAELARLQAVISGQRIDLLHRTAQVDELAMARDDLVNELNNTGDRIRGLLLDIQDRDGQIQDAREEVRISADTIEHLHTQLGALSIEFDRFRESSGAELAIRDTEIAAVGYQLDNAHADDWNYEFNQKWDRWSAPVTR
jgi:hypothetical protein